MGASMSTDCLVKTSSVQDVVGSLGYINWITSSSPESCMMLPIEPRLGFSKWNPINIAMTDRFACFIKSTAFSQIRGSKGHYSDYVGRELYALFNNRKDGVEDHYYNLLWLGWTGPVCSTLRNLHGLSSSSHSSCDVGTPCLPADPGLDPSTEHVSELHWLWMDNRYGWVWASSITGPHGSWGAFVDHEL